jgi:hypothetical protein
MMDDDVQKYFQKFSLPPTRWMMMYDDVQKILSKNFPPTHPWLGNK